MKLVYIGSFAPFFAASHISDALVLPPRGRFENVFLLSLTRCSSAVGVMLVLVLVLVGMVDGVEVELGLEKWASRTDWYAESYALLKLKFGESCCESGG